MSHYDWLNDNLLTFFDNLEIENVGLGIISAHGDKCYGYRYKWEEASVPFEHGVAIYFLSYIAPYGYEVRSVDDDWVDPGQWVIDNYKRFKQHLPEADK